MPQVARESTVTFFLTNQDIFLQSGVSFAYIYTFASTLSLSPVHFHFSESAKLKEARAKEWESLSENTITHAFVNRETIVEDILQLYRVNETIASAPLEVKFLNEPAKDADGLGLGTRLEERSSFILSRYKFPCTPCGTRLYWRVI